MDKNEINIYSIIRSSEEDEKLGKLKDEIIKSKIQYNSLVFDDNYLIRFLRASKCDVEQSFEMFKKCVEWRKNEKIDEIHLYDYKEELEVLSLHPRSYHKTDKLGRPIHYELLANLNMGEVLELTSIDRIIKYNVKKIDYVMHTYFPICSKKVNRNVYQTVNITDMKDFSLYQIGRNIYDYIQADSVIMQEYYPEILGKVYILNTGYIFMGIWAIIKTFLNEATTNRVSFPGSDYIEDLQQTVILFLFFILDRH